MAMTESVSDFLDTDEFADEAFFNGSSQAITGIFNNPYEAKDVGSVGFDAVDPSFLCAESDVPNVQAGQLIVIKSVTYKIYSPEPDGTGFITLNLQTE